MATPGRLLDLMGQGEISLSDVEFFVLDEADRMLDMGFIRDIRRVLSKLPDENRIFLFSATMPDSIVALASDFLTDPVRVEVNPQSTTVERIEQRVMFVEKANKKLLAPRALKDNSIFSVVVFTRTKHGANKLVKILTKHKHPAAAIHGNKSQGARQRALAGFKSSEIRILVATDIASRGIDVDGVSHVINYELPNISESYVHRIGRTGRAGQKGIAISFCDETETEYLTDIEKPTGHPVERIVDHEWHFAEAIPKPKPARTQPRGQRGQQNERRRPARRDNEANGPRSSRGARQKSDRDPRAEKPQPGDGTAAKTSDDKPRSNRRRRRRPRRGPRQPTS